MFENDYNVMKTLFFGPSSSSLLKRAVVTHYYYKFENVLKTKCRLLKILRMLKWKISFCNAGVGAVCCLMLMPNMRIIFFFSVVSLFQVYYEYVLLNLEFLFEIKHWCFALWTNYWKSKEKKIIIMDISPSE